MTITAASNSVVVIGAALMPVEEIGSVAVEDVKVVVESDQDKDNVVYK